MKSKLFAALAALAIISGSTVSARAQDNEAADKQAQVDSEVPENSEAQDQSQYSNQSQDDSNAQYDNQAEYDRPAQNNTRVQPDAQASQNAQAQNNQDTGASAAGVARISLLRGDVSTQRGDSGDWSTAALNQPVVAGDRVSTSEASRAEVQLDFANILRVISDNKYTGLVNVELSRDSHRGPDVCRRSMEFLQATCKKLTGPPSATP